MSSHPVESMIDNRLFSPGYGLDTFIILLMLGGIIFGFFYVFKRYILPVFDARKKLKKTRILVFRIEVIVWLVFALFTVTQFLTESILVTGALLIVVALIGFNFWRDFFPGLWIRLSNKYKVNSPVRFQEYSGVVNKVGITSLYLKTEEEELIFIPYHKLSSAIFIQRQAKGKLMSSKLILQIANKDPELVIKNVDKWIQECPWAIPQESHLATIQPGGLLNVTVYAVDNFSIGKVERHIKNCLDKLE